MFKRYKFRIYPTKDQEALMTKTFGCVRWIYNWGLEKKTKSYKNGIKLSCIDLCNLLPKLKTLEETRWLSEIGAQYLQMSLRNLDNAYTNFLKKRAKFPKFKTKTNKQSFQISQEVYIKENRLHIRKFSEGIKINLHRKFDGKIKTTTISRNKAGKYFASILVENQDKIPLKPIVEKNLTIGIDMGVKTLAILSDGMTFDNPKFRRNSGKRLKVLQRRMSKKGIKSHNAQKK